MTDGVAPATAPRWQDRIAVFAVACVARLAVVVWAGQDFAPAADGRYYDIVARRIAEGQGYTWLWPDGAVTYAAHYPVGYPAFIGSVYALFGARPLWAMVANALVGALGVSAGFELLARATSRNLARIGAVVLALHPALLLYTPALMTEGMTTSLLSIATAFAARAKDGRRRWWMAAGLAIGAATLVRPQSIVLAPILAAFTLPLRVTDAMVGTVRLRALGPLVVRAVAVTALALAVCAPWTVRNCVRMDRCALVSVNGGWNLAIGTETEDGAWRELSVPPECREVFAEAAKDTCFGKAARARIAREPWDWLRRAPRKVRVTLDYFGAAPWYLHEANAVRFPYRAKVILGVIETVVSRLLLAGALVTVTRIVGPRKRGRQALAALGLVACVLVPGTVGYVALAVAILALGLPRLLRASPLLGMTAATIVTTVLIHAAFFGAGRYGLVVVPFVTLLAFVRGT